MPEENKACDKLKSVKIEISSASLRYEKTIKRLAAIASVSITLLLVWALVFKLGSTIMLERNYRALCNMTVEERIMWDIIPFNYRHVGEWLVREILDTVLNCFVFAPLSFALCFFFKKGKLIKAITTCFAISALIEFSQIFTMWANPATEDLITNLVSSIIGALVYFFFFRRLTLKTTVRFWTVANVLLSVFLVFAAVTMAIAAELIFKIITGTL